MEGGDRSLFLRHFPDICREIPMKTRVISEILKDYVFKSGSVPLHKHAPSTFRLSSSTLSYAYQEHSQFSFSYITDKTFTYRRWKIFRSREAVYDNDTPLNAFFKLNRPENPRKF